MATPTGPRGTRLTLALAWAAMIAADLFFAAAISTVEFNDRLLTAFESRSAAYRRYQAYLDTFPNDGNDVLVYAEAPDFADPDTLAALADFVLEVQFLDEVGGVLSPFAYCHAEAARRPDCPFLQANWQAPDLPARMSALPDEVQETAAFLSRDRGAVLLLVSAPGLSEDHAARTAFLGRVEALAEAMLGPRTARIEIAGFPVVRSRVTEKLVQQVVLLSLVGMALGTAVGMAAIGSVRIGLVAAFAAITALIWSLGTMVLLGFEINVVTIAMPTLILVVALAASVHLSLEVHARAEAGHPAPVGDAVRRVVPAAALAAATTGIALGSLTLSPALMIRQLGFAGAFAPLVAFAAVFCAVPLAAATLAGRDGAAVLARRLGARRAVPWRAGALARLAVRRRGAISAAGLAVAVVTAALHIQVPTSFSLFEGLSERDQVMAAIRRIEERLTPVGTIQFPLPADPPDRLQAATEILREAAGRSRVIALEPGDAALRPEDIPDAARQRFRSADGATALVTVLYPYRSSLEARDDIARLDLALRGGLAARGHDAADAGATGLIAVSARVSEEMLRAFGLCFVVAILASGALIAAWRKSLLVGAIAMVPNAIPVTILGSYLYLSGLGMSFAGGVALTIAFGIAIDDTVHVLNRLRIVAARTGRLDDAALCTAVAEVSPALVISSLVLIAGSVGALMSTMPSLVHFAQLSIVVFVVALICDLVLLPALLSVAMRRWPRAVALPGVPR